jgi:drug/metabolite transporter (DMT)-like permease
VGNLSSTDTTLKTNNVLTAAALVAANFFYGTNVLPVKKLSPHLMEPEGISFARIAFTSIMLLVLGFFTRRKEPIEKKDYLLLMVAGLLGVTCNQTFSVIGMAATNPIHSSLLIMSTPIIVTVLAAIFLQERFGLNKVAGLLMGLSGAFLLIMNRTSSVTAHPASLQGDLLILAGSVCYSTYLILIRRISQKYSPLTILRFVFLFGALFSLPLTGPALLKTSWNAFGGWDWFAFGYIIILGTLAANLMMNWGVRTWGPSKTGSFVYFQPFFGTIGAILILGEQFSMMKLAAGILIIAGVWVTSLKREAKD